MFNFDRNWEKCRMTSVCLHLFPETHLTQNLSLSCGRLSSRGSYFGPPTACLHGSTGFFAGTHQCATQSRMTLWQSANPSLCCLESWHRVFCALGFVVVFHAHVQLRILTLLLDWKRCSSSQSSSFSVIRTIRSKISAGWGCSLQLNFSCLLPAMSQSA